MITIVVLLILAGVSIAALTGDNGILTNAGITSTQYAYKAAEEQVELAYTAVLTDIMAKTAQNGTYNPIGPEETPRLANIVRKDLGLAENDTTGNGKWKVEEDSTKGIIKITYTDSKIDQGVMGTANLIKINDQSETIAIPRYEGVVYFQINLLVEQDAKLYVDIENGGGGGLSQAEQTALEENEIEVITSSNDDLNDTSKIRMVLTGDVPIPVSATYVTGTESTGVVIEYKGSEFVWVPVPVAVKTGSELVGTTGPKPMAKVATVSGYASGDNSNPNYEGVLYDFSVSGESVTSQERSSSYGQGTKSYKEPDKLSKYDTTSYDYLKNIGFVKNDQSDSDAFLSTLKSDYKEMVESVAKYGGFYVGRYETSIDGTTVASKKSPDATSIMPMTAETTSGNMWYGMYDKQRKFSGIDVSTGNANEEKLQSSMIWGSQWDAMLNWMITGSEEAKVMENNHGNHNNSGAVGCGTYNSNGVYDVINNIYDLEGNLSEWTLEAYSTGKRVYRGSGYDETQAPGIRDVDYPYGTDANNGSRLSLYIK